MVATLISNISEISKIAYFFQKYSINFAQVLTSNSIQFY